MSNFTVVNDESTPVEEISAQLREKRPLPLGMKEADEWFDRIWSGALIPAEPGKEEELKLSCKHAAFEMILHLGVTETHKEDAHFIYQLRKVAANQIALAQKNAVRAVMKAKEDAKKQQEANQPNT
jgi:hypothetical protein